MKILSPNQIRDLEKKIVNNHFITNDILMENAAHAVYREISSRFTKVKVLVLCGPGNNGGDGLALARILHSENWDVTISYLYKPNYRGQSLRNFNSVESVNTVDIEDICLSKEILIVDALFGIGLNREFDPKTQKIISKINDSKSEVLSIDIPSGVNGLNGTIMGSEAIKANITLTFLTYKLGQFIFPGANFCGNIIVSPISVPASIINSMDAPSINIPIKLLDKKLNSHKTSYGKVLTIAGSSRYFGAPFFSSKAALLSGSGYSSLITPEKVANICATLAPEVIYCKETDLKRLLLTSNSVIFGPGLGIDDRSRELFKNIVENQPKNLIIDADGLTLLSEDLSVIKKLNEIFVITPHPGEMSKLLDKTIVEIEKNRIKYALEASIKFNCIVVLKGVYTVITTPNKDVYINKKSSVTLSTAGCGDILCGIIAGLTGYLDLTSAVRAAVYIHGLCGIIAEKEIGLTGPVATDILKLIPRALKKYKTYKEDL